MAIFLSIILSKEKPEDGLEIQQLQEVQFYKVSQKKCELLLLLQVTTPFNFPMYVCV